jgi:hypothetical protein
MTGESPAAVPPERCQSTVDGDRSSPIIALADISLVMQVFMPQQRWIEGSSPGAFPPSDKMGEVMSDDLQGRWGASLGVQGLEILLN